MEGPAEPPLLLGALSTLPMLGWLSAATTLVAPSTRADETIGGDESGRLGDAVLLAIVGLLKATLDDDDPLQARHLEL